jgi:glycosyltransferase involved in cell wall biosynthesis
MSISRVDIITSFSGGAYHSRYSGYESLIRFIGCLNRVFYTSDYRRVPKFCYPLRIAGILPKFYRSLHAEIAALRSDGQLLHHLYGEDTLWMSLIGSHSSSRPVVATVHQPPAVLQSVMPLYWRKRLSKLAGIITLAPEQYTYLRRECETLVSLVPHGIDTDHFAPAKTERSVDFAISVGSHLRDYQTLARAMETVSEKAPKLRLLLISVDHGELAGNMAQRSHVSEEELLQYYRCASFLVLPVLSLVASNTMLEAMACGLPLICPDSASARYYLGDGELPLYLQNSPESLAERILWLYNHEDERRVLSSRMVTRAQQFAWEKVSSSIRDFYELVLQL